MTLTDHDPTEVLPRLCDECGGQLTMRDLSLGHRCPPLAFRTPEPSPHGKLLASVVLIGLIFLFAFLTRTWK